MYNMSVNSKIMRYQELLQTIETAVDTHSLSCSHLALIAIKTTLTLVPLKDSSKNFYIFI